MVTDVRGGIAPAPPGGPARFTRWADKVLARYAEHNGMSRVFFSINNDISVRSVTATAAGSAPIGLTVDAAWS